MKRTLLASIGILACCSLLWAVSDSSPQPEGKKVKKQGAKAGLASETIKQLQTITLKIEQRDGHLHFSWHPAAAQGSGIKIVYSTTNPEPVYPQDPYVAWLPEAGVSSYVLQNTEAAAQPAYYRVCAVRLDDHSVPSALSNVVRVEPVAASAATQQHWQKKQAGKKDRKPELQRKQPVAAEKKAPGQAGPCAQCGKKCGPGANFCAQCGHKLKP